MATIQSIQAKWNVDIRLAFIAAYKKTDKDLVSCADLPVDTGNLKKGIELKVGQLIGDRLTATFRSTAESRTGFDYPAYINEVSRIAPTKAKYLTFEVGGQFVNSSGFENTHRGWYDKCWQNGQLWNNNIRAEFRK